MPPARYHAGQLERFPGPDKPFVISSAYELFEAPGTPPIGLAVKAYQVERTGSWKTCADHWFGIRPDGRRERADTLDNAASAVRRMWRVDVREAAQVRRTWPRSPICRMQAIGS